MPTAWSRQWATGPPRSRSGRTSTASRRRARSRALAARAGVGCRAPLDDGEAQQTAWPLHPSSALAGRLTAGARRFAACCPLARRGRRATGGKGVPRCGQACSQDVDMRLRLRRAELARRGHAVLGDAPRGGVPLGMRRGRRRTFGGHTCRHSCSSSALDGTGKGDREERPVHRGRVGARGEWSGCGSDTGGQHGTASDDIGDVTWTVPTVTLYYRANIRGTPGHNWADAIAMATPNRRRAWSTATRSRR